MGRLNMRRMMEAELAFGRREDEDSKLFQQSCEIHARAKLFEAVVWFPRLQAVVNGTDARGMSCEVRGVKILTWCCVGRCLITLRRDGHEVTLITADDEAPWTRAEWNPGCFMGPMGVQHVDGDFMELLQILHTATRHGGEIALKPNDDVSIA